jgi:hypothetical protein
MLLGKKSSEALNQQALKNTSPTIYKLNAMNMMQPQMMTKAIPSNKKAALVNKK